MSIVLIQKLSVFMALIQELSVSMALIQEIYMSMALMKGFSVPVEELSVPLVEGLTDRESLCPGALRVPGADSGALCVHGAD